MSLSLLFRFLLLLLLFFPLRFALNEELLLASASLLFFGALLQRTGPALGSLLGERLEEVGAAFGNLLSLRLLTLRSLLALATRLCRLWFSLLPPLLGLLTLALALPPPSPTPPLLHSLLTALRLREEAELATQLNLLVLLATTHRRRLASLLALADGHLSHRRSHN